MSSISINQTTLQIVRGSVTDQHVDAIVNAANTAMRGGGGIDGRIHDSAGPGLLEELKRVAPNGAETGTAVLTSGHRLKQPYIIHTPGPVWHGGTRGEPEKLAACYRSAARLAHEHRLTSMAFCSISTGIYGYPLEQAAPLAIRTIIDFLQQTPQTSLRRCIFAMYQHDEFLEFSKALMTTSQ
jgi:O-acetyl-ADP-ribose deacetylase (regulator of RNase III)